MVFIASSRPIMSEPHMGAELLVRGAPESAPRLGLSALAVGLTVVAFGTSAPEWGRTSDQFAQTVPNEKSPQILK
ncbi:MAG: hypothetical protein EA384_01865 [Spirochaetaceae bacterium]|nr:MAG: hypothetical protein EA384_01865 [Spirochaetaceae bacterium]